MVPAPAGPAAEPIYRPILAIRRGELEALSHLDRAIVPLLAPILELSPTDRHPTDLLSRLPAGLVPAVDLNGLPPGTELPYWDGPVIPVIGLAESDRRLATHAAVTRTAPGRAGARRAVIRLRLRHYRYGPDATTGAVERIWQRARLVPEECELLIDSGDICCAADARVAEPRVRRLVDWAQRYAWHSVTVAAGAMPPTLSRLPVDEPVQLPRWDWLLWRRLAGSGVGYGDYGVGSAMPDADERPDRLPTMRYTADGAWWIYRWSRRGGRGDQRVADLCRSLVRAPHWVAEGATFSWGDHEIVRRARRTAGAGSPTNWAAWSTSHHLAHVLAALLPAASRPTDRPSISGRRAGRPRPAPLEWQDRTSRLSRD